MTREELYRSIYSHDTIYIPPHEAGSAALEVAVGCSWHKCTFCDFAKDKFHLFSLEEIEQKLQILSQLQPDNPRLFLLGENAFVMDCERLMDIMALARRYMPKVESFAMYSRVDDVLRKTDEELTLLKKNGVRALHIGVESGFDPILAACNKGITSEQTVEALLRLDKAGIDYYVTVIPGLGGRQFSRANAIETARMLNRTHPRNIWCLKLHLYEDTKLYYDAQLGGFDMMDPREILWEERLLIEQLSVQNCLFEDTTVLNQFTIMGMLPDQKHKLLNAIDYLLSLPVTEKEKDPTGPS